MKFSLKLQTQSIKPIGRLNTLEVFSSFILVIDMLRNPASAVLSHLDSLPTKQNLCIFIYKVL